MLVTWNKPFLIPNTEMNTTIHSCWKTITDLGWRKENIVEPHTLYFTITLPVNGQSPNNILHISPQTYCRAGYHHSWCYMTLIDLVLGVRIRNYF
jgi:hypothetical protein